MVSSEPRASKVSTHNGCETDEAADGDKDDDEPEGEGFLVADVAVINQWTVGTLQRGSCVDGLAANERGRKGLGDGSHGDKGQDGDEHDVL